MPLSVATRSFPAFEAIQEARVVFLIRSLNIGGTERQLVALATALSQHTGVAVVTFYPGGAFWSELERRGILIYTVAKRGRWDLLVATWRLWRLLRRLRPSVLQTYLPEPNVFGLIAGRLAGVRAIVWGVRSSNMDFARYAGPLAWSFALSARLSRLATLIIANSDAGRNHHIASGYPAAKVMVVPNGIDTGRFSPSAESHQPQRSQWGVGSGTLLIGLVARLDPMKGHLVFIQAAARLARDLSDVKFVCVGRGERSYVSFLRQEAEKYGIAHRFVWTAAESDDEVILAYRALDVACSASIYGEGFSNSVGEAMSCALPCVVTDVGDARHIVDDTGIVVEPADAASLEDGLRTVAVMRMEDRSRLGARARARIIEHFSIELMVRRTARIYAELDRSLSGLGTI